jgi:hypothetical protein
MRHEPSDSCPGVQWTVDQRCPTCRTVRPLDDFADQAGTPTGYCTPCRHRRAAVARRRRQRTLYQVARRAEVSYRAFLAQHREGGDDAA